MNVSRWWLCVLCLSSGITALAAPIASVAVSQFQDLHWRLIGPFRGGRVLAVSGVPGEPSHYYFGSVNGGVWETHDSARTWQPIFDSQPIGSIGALALAPADPKTIYVGSGEADMRSDISQGNGMYKSVDGGKRWTHIGLDDTQQIGRVLVDPTDPNLVYVAALGHPYGANAERGVFRSRDGGKSWQKVLFKNDDTGAIDLAFEPGNARVIYATLWQTRRTPWNIYPPSNGPGGGLYKSSDGGDHWTEITSHGLPKQVGHVGLAVAPSEPKRVYAMVDAVDGGLYRSEDAGEHFMRIGTDARIWTRGWYFGGITVDPKNPDIVYACNTNLYRSIDGGKTFVPSKGAPGGDDYHSLWIDPNDPQRQMLGVDQGAIVSLNGGATWSSWYNQPTGQFYHVITDTRFPYWVYGAQQDSGAAGVPSRSNTIDGINMTQFREMTAGGESGNIAPDPDDPDVIYGGTVGKLDLRTQQTQDIDPTFAFPDHHRSVWTLPLTFSHRDDKVLYFANQRLYRTDDKGEHWQQISADLTRENPEVPKTLDAPTIANNEQLGPRRGVIYAIAPSRLLDHDIWVGTDDGLIWRTRDEGQHWSNITPKALGSWDKIGTIDTSHFDAETAYVAVDRHRLDDFKPYIYRTRDGGKNWQLIANGIPQGSATNVVRADPIRQGLLYAGTEKGVYVSFDDGDHWQALQQNLPITSVRDIDVHGNDLVIATHGRAFWIMDDISPLRQLDGIAQTANVWLFAPALTQRLRPAGFTGTPLPRDEPLALNPPDGASIDYLLKQPSSTPIVVTITDAQGRLVRRYSSADIAPKLDPAKLGVAPEWFESPLPLSAAAGMHRFVWPLRYAAAPALADGNAFADGVWAPPGKYSVELNVNGERKTQALTIEADPRIHLPPDAYAKQFALARQLENSRAQLATANQEATRLDKALALQRTKTEARTGKSIDSLRAHIAEITGMPEAANPGNVWYLPPKSLQSFRYLGTTLDKLNLAVGNVDAAPTADAQTGFAKLNASLAQTLAQWQQLKSTELVALNQQLKSANQPALELGK
jgi:photosystem II stability/assembly factor-like uncharacterized protein